MNKYLYDKKIKITNKVVQDHIKKCAKEYESNQLWNIVHDDFNISYPNLKKFKHYFDLANSSNEEFEKKGGHIFKKEIDKILSNERNNVSSGKKIKHDIGMTNQYNKSHIKFNTHVSKLESNRKLTENKIKIEMTENMNKKEACVCVLIHEPTKNILMLKREPNDSWMANKWSFVGGMLDSGEDKTTCVTREIEEETGISDVTAQYCWTKDTDSVDVHFYIGKTKQQDVKLSDEHSEYIWCKPSSIDIDNAIPDTLDDIKKTLEIFNSSKEDLNEDSLYENDTFTATMDQSLKELMPYLKQKMGDVAQKIGDRDGQLDTEDQNNDRQPVDEALIPMLAGAAMVLPEIMKIVSKWGTKMGAKYDNKTVQIISKQIEKTGHKLHHKYEDIMVKLITPFTRKLNDEQRRKLAKNIIFSIIVTLAVSAITSSGVAFKAGDVSVGSIETVLGGIKVKEILDKVKTSLPQLIAQNAY